MNRLRLQKAQQTVAEFNRQCPVGTAVRFWRGSREGAGMIGSTRSEAELLGGHTPVVWIHETSGAIALTHVEPIATRPLTPAA